MHKLTNTRKNCIMLLAIGYNSLKDHGYVCSKEENYRDAHRHNNVLQVLSLPQGPYSSHYFIICGFAILIDYIVFLLYVILHKRWFMLIVARTWIDLNWNRASNMVMHNHELLEKL
ncbi:hypothetical protein ACJX0J_022563, partial [Zea mays]